MTLREGLVLYCVVVEYLLCVVAVDFCVMMNDEVISVLYLLLCFVLVSLFGRSLGGRRVDNSHFESLLIDII